MPTLPRWTTLATLLLVLTALLHPAPARAQAPDPASAVSFFFQALANKDYASAWRQLSAKSQNDLVSAVAADEKMDPGKVRRLFESSDPAICNGFWESFRQSANPQVFAQATFKTLSTSGNQATVAMEGVPPEKAKFYSYQEGGGWKFGLLETFPMDGGPK